MTRVVLPRFVSADLDASAPALSRSLVPRWTAPARYRTARTDFFRVGDATCLVDDALGVVEVGREPTEDETYRPWRRWDISHTTIGWSADGQVVLSNQAGEVFTWRPTTPPVRWWTMPGPASERSVHRVSDDQALVIRWEGERTTALWNVLDDRAVWTRPAATTTVLPAGDTLVLKNPDLSTACVALDSGRELWQHRLELLGIVDDLVWVSGDRQVVGVELATGRLRHDIAVELVRNPHGPIGPDGVLHLATGLSYQQLDLRAGGERRCFQTYAYDPVRRGPAEAAGAPTADGRFVFFDHGFGLWVIQPDEKRTLEAIWQMPARVFRWTIAHDAIYAIDEERRLHCIGEPVPGAATVETLVRTPIAVPAVRDTADDDDEPELSAIWQARVALPIERPSVDASGRIRGGTLSEDAVIDGLPCRKGFPVTFWIPDGALRSAVLAGDLTIGMLDAPRGSRIETWQLESVATVALVHSVWIALDRLVHGLRLPAGTEVVFGEDGRTVVMAMLCAATVVAGRRVPAGEAIYCHDDTWELDAR